MKSNTRSTALLFAALLPLAAFAAADAGKAANAAPKAAYPLDTCIVSGEKLGEMGQPVDYTYKQAGKPDRLVRFCCNHCIADFEKDPAKYLAKLDAAAADKAKAGAKEAPAHHH